MDNYIIMNNINRYIQTSPLILLTTRKNIIYDYLHSEKIEIDDDVFAILKKCKNRIIFKEIIDIYEIGVIKNLLEKKLLLFESDLWKTTNVKRIEIETCTYCNYRCIYCPVSNNPRHAETMSMELFDDIITKAARYKKIKSVTFNSYNEPTIDKYFEERVLRLANTNIKLVLHTNASNLDREKMELLVKSNVLQELVINLPSIDKSVFKNMTGFSNFEQTIDNINMATEYLIPIRFDINGTKDEIKENLPAIKRKYKLFFDDKLSIGSSYDRAGLLTNQYSQNIDLKDKYLYGLCDEMLNTLYISASGNAFICCNDYFQRYTYGNISNYEIDDLINNERAQKIRKLIYGEDIAPDDFICRKCKDMQRNKMLRMCFFWSRSYPD